ncbi:hypothetical protein WMY93_027551 [Mugilogobius chulae]|uniref:L1 transposable element RRM domain-containing protein n=1 Tax=Mugilogobius chulae TaxID=88201 RepID=A0AAW0MXT8_9GOBI
MASKPKTRKTATKDVEVLVHENANSTASTDSAMLDEANADKEVVTNRIIIQELREYRQEIKAEFAKTNNRLNEAENGIEGNERRLQDMEEALTATTDMQIENAHRALGRQPPPEAGPRLRSILVKFQSFRMMEEVIRLEWQKKGFTLDSHKISLDHDYAPEILNKRKEYAEARRILKENKIRFQMLYPARLRVHYDDGQKTYDTIEEATTDMANRGFPVKVIKQPASVWEKIQLGAWQAVRYRRSNCY